MLPNENVHLSMWSEICLGKYGLGHIGKNTQEVKRSIVHPKILQMQMWSRVLQQRMYLKRLLNPTTRKLMMHLLLFPTL